MKKVLSIFVYILLAVLLIINAFTLTVKNNVLKSSVVNTMIDKTGVYETVYQEFEQQGKRKAMLVVEDNNLNPELGDWMWNNISEVFDEDYVEYFTRINIEAIVKYVLGEEDELATFNLTPKYAELMDVTADNLDAQIITQVIEMKSGTSIKALNILNGLLNNDSVKRQVVEYIFESTDKIKAPFLATTTEQLLGLVGQEEQLENIHDARLSVEKFNRYVSGLVVVILLICIAMVISSVSNLQKFLNDFWVVFAISGTIVLIAGLAIGYFEINVVEFINDNILDIGFKNKQSAISSVLYIVAYSSMKIGLFYVVLAVISLILTYVFGKKDQRSLN